MERLPLHSLAMCSNKSGTGRTSTPKSTPITSHCPWYEHWTVMVLNPVENARSSGQLYVTFVYTRVVSLDFTALMSGNAGQWISGMMMERVFFHTWNYKQ